MAYGETNPGTKPAKPKGTPASAAGKAAKAPKSATSGPASTKMGSAGGRGGAKPAGSRAVKTITRGILAAGQTRGEARGVVQNLRHGTNLKPRAQVQRTKAQMRAEGIGKARIQKTAQAEKLVARRAAARQAARKTSRGFKA